MSTIVEYSTDETPFNGYPERIVSPPDPSACCAREMVPVGRIHRETGFRYSYRQCRECGYTVRRFLDPGAASAGDVNGALGLFPVSIVGSMESEEMP